MSSILKALKKLEHDNSNRKYGAVKVDADILRDTPPRRFPLAGAILLAMVLFICGAGAAYLYLKPGGAPGQVTVTAKAAAVRPAPQAVPSVISAPSVGHTRSDNVQPPAPMGEHTIVHPRPQVQSMAASPVPVPNAPTPRASETLKTPPPVHPNAAPVTSASDVVQQSPKTELPPVLKVNGIAYQARDEDSMAVVNGVTVSNGSIIAGAKVEGVLPDRVQFSFKGEKFDVFLGKSNR